MNKLFLITRTTPAGWDEYVSAVVVATSEQDARVIHPSYPDIHGGTIKWGRQYDEDMRQTEGWFSPNGELDEYHGWVTPSQVTAKYIGEASPTLSLGRVVTNHFNNG